MALTDATGKLVNSYHNSAGVVGDWHQFAHQAKDNPLNQAHLVSLNKWIVTDVFGRFLQQLDVEEANGKTFLDNSLVLMGGELSMDVRRTLQLASRRLRHDANRIAFSRHLYGLRAGPAAQSPTASRQSP
jgi:hypothetical protein